MHAEAVEVIRAACAEFAAAHVPMAPLTTYRLGGPAALLVRPRTIGDLEALAAALAAAGGPPVLVIGRGSNLLVADRGFDGVVVVTSALGDRIEIAGVEVVADANVLLPVAARQSVQAGLTGLEWAVGVPGSIGGGVRMNAGGHGSDIAASLVSADVFDLRRSTSATVPGSALGLRFRGSLIADQQLVMSVRLQLEIGDRGRSEQTLSEIVRWRREHQPGGQNAGSVFVNPVPGEVAAGELIDRIGLRGHRIGGAYVSDKHANFIQAGPGATAADVRGLIDHVRRRVAEVTGYQLRTEIRHVGFDDDDAIVGGDLHAGVRW
jgi:UDP-N-acetylmuramate dehydrogenase